MARLKMIKVRTFRVFEVQTKYYFSFTRQKAVAVRKRKYRQKVEKIAEF